MDQTVCDAYRAQAAAQHVVSTHNFLKPSVVLISAHHLSPFLTGYIYTQQCHQQQFQ